MQWPSCSSSRSILAFNFDVYELPALDIWVSLEQMTQCILDATTATDISLKPRLIFDCTDEVLQRVFTRTDDGTTLPPAYLPFRHTLVEWAQRLKQRYPLLRTFNLDLKCSTFGIDAAPDDQLLQFEYRAAEAYTEDSEWSIIRKDINLRNQSGQEESRQYRYTVYPGAIPRCYDRLVKEAEAEVLEMANAQAAPVIVAEVAGRGIEGAAG